MVGMDNEGCEEQVGENVVEQSEYLSVPFGYYKCVYVYNGYYDMPIHGIECGSK